METNLPSDAVPTMLSLQALRRVRRSLAPAISLRSESQAATVGRPVISVRESPEETKPFNAIPGPKPLPVIRNLLEFKRNSGRLFVYLEECHKKYGSLFKLEAPGQLVHARV